VSDGLSDLIISRQPMFSTTAWRKNGCYTLGAQDIVDLPLDGFSLTESGEWTVVETPTIRGVVMKKGLWSVVRDWLPSSETETTGVWILYSNNVSEKSMNSLTSERLDYIHF
jgi:hypothetical protein